VAVKQLQSVVPPTQKQIEEFESEIKLMVLLTPHPNVIQMIGVVQDPSLWVVMEFMETSLQVILETKELSEEWRTKIAKGTAAGIEHIHSQGIVHRDIAARNVLLDSDWVPKISDCKILVELNFLSWNVSITDQLEWRSMGHNRY
jgi:serine/threonine protein kinase